MLERLGGSVVLCVERGRACSVPCVGAGGFPCYTSCVGWVVVYVNVKVKR